MRKPDLIGLTLGVFGVAAPAFWLMTVPGSPAWRAFGLLTGLFNLASAARLWTVAVLEDK